MRKARKGFREETKKTIKRLAIAQTIATLFCAALIIFINDILNTNWSKYSMLGLILSIPSLSFIAIWRLNYFEKRAWRRKFKYIDFNGKWQVECDLKYDFTDGSPQKVDIKNNGIIEIRQTPFKIELINCNLKSNNNNLGGWDWLSATVSEDGNVIETLYKMTDLPDLERMSERSHGIGYEHIRVTEREKGSSRRRPIKLESYWYDCVNPNNFPTYIGKNTFTKIK